MFNKDFKYVVPSVNPELINQYNGNIYEKDYLYSIFCEWNCKNSVSELCMSWIKTRPPTSSENLSVLLWNCEGLSTHLSDFHFLLTSHRPLIFILTGVGKQIRALQPVPNYKWFSQEGSNSFGGGAILVHQRLKCSIEDKYQNFLLLQFEILKQKLYIAGVYVPPNSTPPFDVFDKHKDKNVYFFGDFNSKHGNWNCETSNVSGNRLNEWLEDNGFETIHTSCRTSKKSNSVIDFCVGKCKENWSVERLDEGNSDHYPILFFPPFTAGENGIFRKTNWDMFTFFLQVVYPYWNTFVYNVDYNCFFNVFSQFLAALRDRCSDYENIKLFRPPWPPHLVDLVRIVNKYKRKFRRTRFLGDYKNFKYWQCLFMEEKVKFEQEKRDLKIKHMKEGNNIWSHVNQIFRPYTPSFKGLTTSNGILKDNQQIADQLANYYEKHFCDPIHDNNNLFHLECLEAYEKIKNTPNISLCQIKMEEVILQWKKFASKKSLDSLDNSAFLLKQLPAEYMNTITVLFNKCAESGDFFETGKIAKGIFLSKDGAYPTESRLRSISLLPNLSKVFERVIVARIEKWCSDSGVHLDEQSGFTSQKRLQTRILAIIEDLRLTVAACNRPALAIFVDFATAFDKMWWPALMKTLEKIDMPLELRRFIFNWLQNRKMRVSHGDANSKLFPVLVGAPQGSVLAALLFRLHIHFLPSYFPQIVCHLFADDLTMIIKGALEMRLSANIKYLESQAKRVLKSLENFSDNHILPVNVSKTKAMLVHSAVNVSKPDIKYKDVKIEYVTSFKCLGIELGTKLGMGNNIANSLKKVRGSFCALRKIFLSIPRHEIKIRRRIFCAFSLPHFSWLFSTWFYFTDKQREKIEHVYVTGLRIVYSLWGFEDFLTLALSREYTLRDYLYRYWIKFYKHLDEAPEAESYRQTWNAYLIATSPTKCYYRSCGFRRNSVFPNRLSERAKHTYLDFLSFKNVHKNQYGLFKRTSSCLETFILKYFSISP
jgi:hypothetical protein